MKKIILFSALLMALSLSAQNPPNYNTITDLTFTDIDGQTHNLYDLIGDGYRVILDFGFIGCEPCAAWSQYIGPELWDEYGPDGDNTLRMFYFEVYDTGSDSYVNQYYSNLGVEYPIVNINFEDTIESEYQAFFDNNVLDGGYPVHIYVCQDTTYRLDIGFHYPTSLNIAEHILDNSCNGQDLHYKDVAMIGLQRSFSYCSQSEGPIEFIPELTVHHNGGIEYHIGPSTLPPQEEYSINDTFMVKTYINNTYLKTDTLDPLDTGDAVSIGSDDTTQGNIGAGIEWDFLLPAIEVQINDSVKFELLYPEDSYMLNNTYSFKVEQEEETKTASNNQLRLAFGSPYMYAYFCEEDEVGVEFACEDIILQAGYDTIITVNNGQCYALSFVNAHLGDAYLIQTNNNDTLIHHMMDGTTDFSEFYYFNVDSSQVSIGDYNASLAKLIDIQYFDLLGRAQKTSYFHHLPQGIYIEVKRFDNGNFEQRKRMKLE